MIDSGDVVLRVIQGERGLLVDSAYTPATAEDAATILAALVLAFERACRFPAHEQLALARVLVERHRDGTRRVQRRRPE